MFKENAKKVETIIKTSEEPQSSRLNGFQRLKECCFIVGVLSSVLLAVALFTFSPADPSWSYEEDVLTLQSSEIWERLEISGGGNI